MRYSVDDLCREFDITRQTFYKRLKDDSSLASAAKKERQQGKNKRVFFGEETRKALSMVYQSQTDIDNAASESVENQGGQAINHSKEQSNVVNDCQLQLIDELKRDKEYLQKSLEKSNEEKQQLLEQNNNLLILLAQEQKKNAILLLEPPKKSLWQKFKNKLVRTKDD